VKELGGKVAVFNMEDTSEDADFLFVGPCEELLPMALGLSESPFVAAFKAE
jgi:NAD-dependent deacetylase sirtuin 5